MSEKGSFELEMSSGPGEDRTRDLAIMSRFQEGSQIQSLVQNIVDKHGTARDSKYPLKTQRTTRERTMETKEIEELMDNLTDEQVDAANAGIIEKMLDPEPIDDRLDAMGELLSHAVMELEKAGMMVPTQRTPDWGTPHPTKIGSLVQEVKNEYQLIINLREEARIVWKEAPHA